MKLCVACVYSENENERKCIFINKHFFIRKIIIIVYFLSNSNACLTNRNNTLQINDVDWLLRLSLLGL